VRETPKGLVAFHLSPLASPVCLLPFAFFLPRLPPADSNHLCVDTPTASPRLAPTAGSAVPGAAAGRAGGWRPRAGPR
jgi:hypothetical protein